MEYSEQYLNEISELIRNLDVETIEKIVESIKTVKDNKGRIFFIGVGGSAANCSHGVNDFRKIVGIECYTPTDNVSELTARTNDSGWDTVFREFLRVSRIGTKDMLFILSVGGGSNNTSKNIINGILESMGNKTVICGIVGKDGGFTYRNANSCILVPTVNPDAVTPYVESIQSVILHLIVNHPRLR